MRSPSRTALRVAFAVVLVLSAGTIAGSFLSAAGPAAPADAAGPVAPGDATRTGTPPASRTATERSGTNGTAAPTTLSLEERINRSNVSVARTFEGNLTVVATQGFYVSDEQAELVAFSEAGKVVYHDDRYRVYFDVDPVPEKRYTVEYVAAKHLSGDACEAVGTDRCTRNVMNRVNLTTGAEREVYGKVTPRIYSARWHDVDRLNETHFVVADIINDSVNVVRENGTVVSRWEATQAYVKGEDGGQPGDWTHVNDVEILPDGRIMASLRNMDEVVFLEPHDGSWVMNDSWTLGEDGDHEILYEQHNPDYIPAERGGPAVVVGDSENGRVVEYRRVNGTWERSWGWNDARLQWPRDADRLPSDTTLIVDSHGDRVVEVRPDGSVVWSVTIGMPYDAERLGTGDESSGGRSIHAIRADGADDDDSRAEGAVEAVDGALSGDESTMTTPDRGLVSTFWLALKELTPSLVVNGLLYASPSWVRFTDLVFGFVFLGGVLSWGGTEFYWSRYSVRGGVGRATERVHGGVGPIAERVRGGLGHVRRRLRALDPRE